MNLFLKILQSFHFIRKFSKVLLRSLFSLGVSELLSLQSMIRFDKNMEKLQGLLLVQSVVHYFLILEIIICSVKRNLDKILTKAQTFLLSLGVFLEDL
jgi:hypothetical protein